MEKVTIRINLSVLFLSTRNLMHSILGFLTCADVANLCVAYNSTPQADRKIAKMLAAYLYLQKHMMATDRSFYYNLYESTRFLEFENAYIAYLMEKPEELANLNDKRRRVMTYLRQLLDRAQSGNVADLIEQLADDPEIPMGKLLRQNIGAGCTSQFQYFLVGLGCEQFDECIEEQFTALDEFLQGEALQGYYKQFFQILKGQQTHGQRASIRRLRMSPYEITFENASTYMLPNNELHNIIVCLFLLAQQMAQAAEVLVSGIEDPSHRLLELMLRYSIFRNFVISVQEKFSFLFRVYSDLYAETFRESQSCPAFNFWRPALAKWFIRMNKFHRECTETLNIYLLTQRLNSCTEFIQEQAQVGQTCCSPLVNKIILDSSSLYYSQPGTNTELKELISEEMEILVREFPDYMMDLSIDECTVNWCGHTEQRLNFPFSNFSASLVQQSEKLFRYMLTLGPDLGVGKLFLEKDLEFLHQNSLMKCWNLQRVRQCANNLLQTESNGQLFLCFTFNPINEDLEYFNSKRKIPVEIPNPSLRRLCQIVPEMELLEETIKGQLSLDTTACTLNESDSNLYVDGSDEEFEEIADSEMEVFLEEESDMLDESDNCSNQHLVN